MYITVDSRAQAWGFKFLAEAKQRWVEERDRQSLLAVASGFLLSLGLKCYCHDNLGDSFMEQSTHLAKELRLFGVLKSTDEMASDENMAVDRYRAKAHVAWGAYSWLELVAHYYGTKVTIIAPSFRIPGEHESEQWQGQNPLSKPSDPKRQTFTALCQLQRIHTKALAAYNTRAQVPLLDRISLQFAEDIYKEMLAWADNLGQRQVRGQYAPDHVLLLQ